MKGRVSRLEWRLEGAHQGHGREMERISLPAPWSKLLIRRREPESDPTPLATTRRNKAMTHPFPSATLPPCVLCQRIRPRPSGGWCCRAFPDAIPAPLLEGRFDHRRPFPGDHGIRFEPDWGAPDEVLALVSESR
jgi:hypothetical protein